MLAEFEPSLCQQEEEVGVVARFSWALIVSLPAKIQASEEAILSLKKA